MATDRRLQFAARLAALHSQQHLERRGRIRHLANPAGDIIVEQLEAYDNAARSYSYSILQAPFPATDYLSTLQVAAIAGSDHARVTWSGRFTPVGVSEQDVTELFHGIYVAGLEALQQTLAT